MRNSKEYQRRYYQAHKEQIRARSNALYQREKHRIGIRQKAYRQTEHGRAVLLTKKFKCSLILWATYWLSIRNCQICGDNLAVATDHDHVTGVIRGRLCYRCNRAIGALEDTAEMLAKAFCYLQSVKQRRAQIKEST